MKSSQRSFTEQAAFLLGSLPAALLAPFFVVIFLLFKAKIDIRSSFDIGAGLVILGLLTFALFEFESDGVISWILGGGVQTPRLGLGFFVGMMLKALAILHGVAAVIFGSLLALEPDTLPPQLSSWPVDMAFGVKIAFVLWLWTMAAVSYLAGDGWVRRARRAENPGGAGLE